MSGRYRLEHCVGAEMGRIVFDYFWITVLMGIVYALIGYFIADLGNSSTAVTTVIAAMVSGQLYGQRTGQEVSSGFAWKVAAVLTVVSLLFGVVVLVGLQLAGVSILPDDVEPDFGILAVLIAAFALIGLLITRFAFRWGVKNGATTAAAKKDKAKIFD